MLYGIIIMHFINRTEEIVIYGRRPVGKTRLLLEWIQKNKGNLCRTKKLKIPNFTGKTI